MYHGPFEFVPFLEFTSSTKDENSSESKKQADDRFQITKPFGLSLEQWTTSYYHPLLFPMARILFPGRRGSPPKNQSRSGIHFQIVQTLPIKAIPRCEWDTIESHTTGPASSTSSQFQPCCLLKSKPHAPAPRKELWAKSDRSGAETLVIHPFIHSTRSGNKEPPMSKNNVRVIKILVLLFFYYNSFHSYFSSVARCDGDPYKIDINEDNHVWRLNWNDRLERLFSSAGTYYIIQILRPSKLLLSHKSCPN